MEVLLDEKLSKYSSFKMGGVASRMYFPTSESDLKQLFEENDFANGMYIISGGSNILINDKKVFDKVINCSKLDKRIDNYGNGLYYVGASVRIQQFINYAMADWYGGIEYLYSLPAMLGGIVAMNAGRGKGWNQMISQHIYKVRIFSNGITRELTKEECQFTYRGSVFSNDDSIILGAYIQLERLSSEVVKSRINQRMTDVKRYQDRSHPNLGSVFCECNAKIMNLFRRIGFGRTRAAHFSKKTSNWLLNGGNATFSDTMFLIRCVMLCHRLVHRDCRLEVKVWA